MQNSSIEKRAFSGALAGSVTLGLNFIQSILLVPVFLQNWGSSKYGLFVVVLSVIALLRYIDFGYQNFIGYEFNKAYYVDKSFAKKLLSSGLKFCLLLGCFETALVTVGFLCGSLPSFLGVPPADVDMYLQWGIISMSLFWLTCGTVGGILVKAILPAGYFTQSAYLGAGLKLLEIAILAVSAFLDLHLGTVFIVLATCSIMYYVPVFLYIRKAMPEFCPWFLGGTIKEGGQYFFRSVGLTFNALFEQTNSSGLNLLVSSFFSTAILPVFVTLRTATNVVSQVTHVVINPMVTEMIRLHTTRQPHKLAQVFKTAWFVSGLVVAVPLTVSMPFVEYLFTWWTKNTIAFDKALYCNLAFSVCLINYGKVFQYYLTGLNNIRALLVNSVLRVFVLFMLSLLLAGPFGLTGIGVAVVVSELTCSIFVPLWFVKRSFDRISFTSGVIDWKSMMIIPLLALFFLGSAFIEHYYFVLLFVFMVISHIVLTWIELSAEVKSKIYTVSRLALFRKAG
jgi:O-antigen/teichoic acid export membrane protein